MDYSVAEESSAVPMVLQEMACLKSSWWLSLVM
jgi:hypothetical protein